MDFNGLQTIFKGSSKDLQRTSKDFKGLQRTSKDFKGSNGIQRTSKDLKGLERLEGLDRPTR